MPAELLNAIIELSKKLHGVNITSVEEGIDITIKRTKPAGGKKGKTSYTALPVYDGMVVKQTPLTAEELEYRELDISKFVGKPIDRELFEAELVEENNVKTIYESADIDSGSEDGEDAPF